jgi:hypothetical protein
MSYAKRAVRSLCTLAAIAVTAVLLFTSSAAHAQACPMAKSSKKYKIKVDSAPQGATVYLDRKDCGAVGVTPWTGTLASGEVTVIVELDGYTPGTKTYKVARTRKVQDVFVPLVKKVDPPKIDISAAADKNLFGAAVILDGQPQGQVPVTITTTAGRHLVQIRKDGFEPFEQWVEAKENGTVSMTPVIKEIPKPKFGSVFVEADVDAAEVYIDGNKHPDKTPTVIKQVVEGLHVIEVRKEPAVPWKQTIQVTADQDTKVKAELKATLGGGGGNLRVMSNVDGAHVFLDGNDMGVVPLDIKDVKSGEHVLEVKAQGYQTREEKVVVNNGQSAIFKLDLNPSGDGTLKVVSPVPEAEVFIDGASVGKVPVEKGVASGEHFVVVKLPGMKNFEQKVRVEAGQTITVSAELKAVGKLRILSQPNGASVTINGQPSGETPLEIEVETGEAIIRIESPGFRADERTLVIEGGKTETISAELGVAGPSPDELLAEQRGLSHFGARTLSRGRSTVSADAGYPYFANIRINVGAGRIGKQFGFDAGVGVRSNLARNEIGLGVRMTLVDQDPFSAGVFGDLWWGSKLLDDSRRNGVTFDAGVLASLTALSHVTITGRAYLNMWSDRHCPDLNGGTFDGEPIGACQGYKERIIDNGNPMDFSAEDATRMEDLTGNRGRDMFTREEGIRAMISVIAEIAIYQRWSIYGIMEGAPFQDERALFTHLFSAPMFDSDFGTYVRIGTTYKF